MTHPSITTSSSWLVGVAPNPCASATAWSGEATRAAIAIARLKSATSSASGWYRSAPFRGEPRYTEGDWLPLLQDTAAWASVVPEGANGSGGHSLRLRAARFCRLALPDDLRERTVRAAH